MRWRLYRVRWRLYRVRWWGVAGAVVAWIGVMIGRRVGHIYMADSHAHLPYYCVLSRRVRQENDHYRQDSASGNTPPLRHLSPQTMWLVLERDSYQCFCCGESVVGQRHSIWRRNRTGDDSPANLITVLGTPSTGCMERLERHDPLDEAKGYILKPGQDPERVPALRHGRTQVWLTAEGSFSPGGGNQPPGPRRIPP